MMYRCSVCRRPVGAMLDREGQPEPFLCPYAHKIAEATPDQGWDRYGQILN